jgi:hypothetical protein
MSAGGLPPDDPNWRELSPGEAFDGLIFVVGGSGARFGWIGSSLLDLPLTITLFPSVNAQKKQERTTTLRELAARIPKVIKPSKAELPLLKGATFDGRRTKGGALRSDQSLVAITLVEVEHDAGQIEPEVMAAALRGAGLAALVYTTPSHRPDAPRWRALLLTSQPLPPSERARLVDRVQGLIPFSLSKESWAASQCWFYGQVEGGAPVETILIDGCHTVDQVADLDATGGQGGSEGNGETDYAGFDGGADVGELLDAIRRGEGSHVAMLTLAGRLAERGVAEADITEILKNALLNREPAQRDAGWHKAFDTEAARAAAFACQKERAKPGSGGGGDPPAQPETARPLRRPLPPSPDFPIEALACAPVLRQAVEAIRTATQAPLALCGSSVLAAASVAAQPHGDVLMPYGAARPLSLFAVSVAESGERKTEVDRIATQPIGTREAELRVAYADQRRAYLIDLAAYEQHKKSLEQTHRKNPAAFRTALKNLGPPPEPPLAPIILADNPTVEGLEKYAEIGQPSFGLFTAEGGKLIGGHLFNDDNRMKAGATLNLFWDGAPVPRIRADGATKLPGRRLALHVMVQQNAAAKLLADPTLDGLGTLARCLITAPPSAAGTRFWRESPPWVAPALDAYGAALTALLQREPQMGKEPNELAPPGLPLSPDAREVWIRCHDAAERRIGPGGAWEPIKALGSKAPEHAARIAGVLTLAADPDATEIGTAALEGGIALVDFYAAEALRLIGVGLADPDIVLAETLLGWLHTTGRTVVHLAEIYQFGPRAIRDKETALRIVRILEDHGAVRRLKPGTEVDGHRRRDAWEVVR